MCNSVLRGKDYTEDFYREEIDNISSVLDIGCGRGIYSGCLKSIKPEVIWHGIEVWEPYVNKYKKNLDRLYDKIFIENVVTFNYDRDYDLVIMGDVIEHMIKEDAKTVVTEAINRSKYIVISIPLGYDPHPPEHGNPYQEHITDDWSAKDVLKLIHDSGDTGPVRFRRFDCAWLNHPIEIGVFIAHGKIVRRVERFYGHRKNK